MEYNPRGANGQGDSLGRQEGWFYTLPPLRLKDLYEYKGWPIQYAKKVLWCHERSLVWDPQSPHRLFPPLIWAGRGENSNRQGVWGKRSLLNFLEFCWSGLWGGVSFSGFWNSDLPAQAPMRKKDKKIARTFIEHLIPQKVTDFINKVKDLNSFLRDSPKYWETRGPLSPFHFERRGLGWNRSWVVFPILYFYQWSWYHKEERVILFLDKFLLRLSLYLVSTIWTSPSHKRQRLKDIKRRRSEGLWTA